MDSTPTEPTGGATTTNHQPPGDDGGLKILELRAETYNGMVRLLKPGYRSIILLTDKETKDQLLPHFRRAVWPYRRNKTLLFGYLCLDKNILWYKSLMEQVTGIEDLNVNKRNCIGTVLSLNGFRRYLRVYHKKHQEIGDQYDDGGDDESSGDDDDEDNIETATTTTTKSDDDHDNDATSTSEVICTPDNLLDRLPGWLDRMFDGLTKRYFLYSWPEDLH